MPGFGRTGTGESSKSARFARSRTTSSFKSQAEDAEDDKPKVYQGRYGVYNGLTWEKLKAFLQEKFKGYTFEKIQRGDYWIFETPEPLSKDDKKALEKERDKGTKRGRRPSVPSSEEE